MCLLTRDITDAEKQRVAAEMNLSETAFVVPEGGEDLSGRSPESVFGGVGRKRFGLRWFTPAAEVPLCGHATVAAAAVIFTRMWNQNKVRSFPTNYHVFRKEDKCMKSSKCQQTYRKTHEYFFKQKLQHQLPNS